MLMPNWRHFQASISVSWARISTENFRYITSAMDLRISRHFCFPTPSFGAAWLIAQDFLLAPLDNESAVDSCLGFAIRAR
jgi:hypothetical protein